MLTVARDDLTRAAIETRRAAHVSTSAAKLIHAMTVTDNTSNESHQHGCDGICRL